MANTNFSLQSEGYNIEEVDRYIEMLREEYQNAVSWGEELEAKLEKIENSMKEAGLYVTVEDENQDEVIAQIFRQLTDTVNSTKSQAEVKASEIIAAANEKSRAIVRQAMTHSVELRTENTTIMENLKSLRKMIDVVLEKGIQ